MNQPKMTPKQMLKTISYNRIKDMREPITGQTLGGKDGLSKKDLSRLVYLLNGELFKLRNELDKIKEEVIKHDLEDK